MGKIIEFHIYIYIYLKFCHFHHGAERTILMNILTNDSITKSPLQVREQTKIKPVIIWKELQKDLQNILFCVPQQKKVEDE